MTGKDNLLTSNLEMFRSVGPNQECDIWLDSIKGRCKALGPLLPPL